MSREGRALALEDLRAQALLIWKAALAAADPGAAVARSLEARPFEGFRGRWELLAAGKAAGAMAEAALGSAGDRPPARGLVITESSQASAVASMLVRSGADSVEVAGGSHPLPDRASEVAARAAEALVSGSAAPLLVLLSGGGSALMAAPCPGIALEDKIETTALLQASGADIAELNSVRRHLSRTKGGGLGRLAEAAGRPVRVLLLSDVLGDALEDIASGPFAGDPTTFADACGICRRRGVWSRLPAAAAHRLEAGARGELEENPEPAELEWIEHQIVGSLARSLEAAVAIARELVSGVARLREWIIGEARVAGAGLADLVVASGAGEGVRAWVGGGETVVTVTGDGVGGRAQELALGFAAAAEGRLDGPWVLLSAGTDGRDGPGDAAGALVDSETLERGRSRGFEVTSTLERNDASALLRATGDLVVTGRTGTNVGDVAVALVAAAGSRTG